MRHYPLVVVLRCHQWPRLILDTVETVFEFCTTMPLVVLSIDNRPQVREDVLRNFPQLDVYCSTRSWGWGPGLYGLLADTIKWLDTKYTYDALVSIDYDTYFIAPGVDRVLLDRYKNSTTVGLVGGHVPKSANWSDRFQRSRKEIEKILAIPKEYIPGESVLGCFMWLTGIGLQRLRENGFLDDPYRDICGKIDLADDPWLALLIRACGLGIEGCRDVGHFAWRLAVGYRGFLKEGMKVFHPTKVNRDKSGWKLELDCRNYFRSLRGKPPLVEGDCYAV